MPITAKLRKILVINLGGMGDLLLSSPALKSLRSAYPEAELSFLVSSKAAEAARRLKLAYRVFIFYPQSFWWIIFRGIFLLWSLRKEGFDLAVNMRTIASSLSALKMRLLLDLINAKITAGRDTLGRAGFLDIKISESEYGDKYERDYDLALIEALGVKAGDNRVEFSVTAFEQDKVASMLNQGGFKKDEVLVGIHPGGQQSRRWPLKYYQGLLRSLSSLPGIKFVITGNAKEAGLGAYLAASFPANTINLSGALSLGELAALIKRCALYICNDTGSLHLAATQNVPILCVFGGGSLTRFDPRKLCAFSCVLRKPVNCAPCNRTFCLSKKCLRLITVEEAAIQARRILKQ